MEKGRVYGGHSYRKISRFGAADLDSTVKVIKMSA